MTFLHKLAQRLARLKVALLIGLLATLACERPVTAVLNTALRVASINVSPATRGAVLRDRKSTRLNSSHQIISYAVFCLKKKHPRSAGRGRPPAGRGVRGAT